jgi:hypothetical protein
MNLDGAHSMIWPVTTADGSMPGSRRNSRAALRRDGIGPFRA